MLNPSNVEDIKSIQKSREIVTEILNYGVSNNEIIKIIDLLSLELEDTSKMRSIQEVLKNKKPEQEIKQKPEFTL